MSDHGFNFNVSWPFVAVVCILVGAGIALFKPEIVTFLVDQGVRLIQSFK